MLRRELPASYFGPVQTAEFWVAEVDAKQTSLAVQAAESISRHPSIYLKRVAKTDIGGKNRILVCRCLEASKKQIEKVFKEKGIEQSLSLQALDLIDRIPVTQVD